MVSYNLEKIEKILNTTHPKQIVSRVDSIHIMLFKASYSYTTSRNNKKSAEKYFLVNSLNPSYNIKQEFYEWLEEYNQKNIHRQISNVKFLEGQCIGFINI